MEIKRLQNIGKTQVNITIDTALLDKINEYKSKHEIKQLSPLINEMLWEWIKQEEESS